MKNKVKIQNWFSETTIRTTGGAAQIDPKRITKAQISGGDTLIVTQELPSAEGSTTYWIKFGAETQRILDAIRDRVEIVVS